MTTQTTNFASADNEKQQPGSKYRTSLHEAAHAVVAQYFNVRVTSIYLTVDIHYGGQACFCSKSYSNLNRLQKALIDYAGFYIEKLYGFNPDRNLYIYASDMETCYIYNHSFLEDCLDLILENRIDHVEYIANKVYASEPWLG